MNLSDIREAIDGVLHVLRNCMEEDDSFRSDDVTYSAEVQRLAVSYLRKAIEMMDKETEMTRHDVCFELRDGERVDFGGQPQDHSYAFGVFTIPTPGHMGKCTDIYGGPTEALKLTAARKNADGTWRWIILGAATHFVIAEAFGDPDKLPRNMWIGAEIVPASAEASNG